MQKSIVAKSLAIFATALVLPASVLASAVDPGLPSYSPARGVSGNITTIGSDTMNNTISLWSEGFRRHYPHVSIEVRGAGSSTAPPALIAGTAQFGPMSRAMRSSEVDAFVKAHGHRPTQLNTSIDMVAVFVHKDNPIACLTLQQVDAMFSTTRRGGHAQEIRTWGDLGLTGRFANMPISLYGRNSASGTHGYFKSVALFGGDFRPEVKEQPGSAGVIGGVAGELGGVGYSGIGYLTAGVRAVPLAAKPGDRCVPAVPRYALTGEYPLARLLMVYVNKQPGVALDPLRREFVRYIFSREGQTDVVRDGYVPISAAVAREQLEKVGIRN